MCSHHLNQVIATVIFESKAIFEEVSLILERCESCLILKPILDLDHFNNNFFSVGCSCLLSNLSSVCVQIRKSVTYSKGNGLRATESLFTEMRPVPFCLKDKIALVMEGLTKAT